MRAPISLLFAACLAGCAAGPGLVPGASTEAEVRAALGRPAAEFPHDDGSRTLAYPYGPMGTQTYMADIGPDGRVRAIRQALNDETFQRISAGMSREEVLRLIGPPGETMRFPRLRQEAWEWRFVDTWGYEALFSVNFDDRGIAVSKFTRRIERERGPFGFL